MPQRFAQRADGEARGFPKSGDDRPARLAVRIKQHRARADLAWIEAHPAPLGQSGIERPVESRLGPRKGVAVIVSGQHRKASEREVPVDDTQFDPVGLLRRRLLRYAH